jgi:hypothetical protein
MINRFFHIDGVTHFTSQNLRFVLKEPGAGLWLQMTSNCHSKPGGRGVGTGNTDIFSDAGWVEVL